MASLPGERILPRFLEDEMRESFLDYSMSVIVSRALPDVRDGLKPVHRRILYSMQELGLVPTRPYKKSATVVGDVLGKYHPHGDMAVYDSLVRMVQDFSLRYPLIDGQGNFGSIDGDPAAAYRYTEARVTPLALEMLADLDKATVPLVPNFDGRLQEPEVLPAKVPNLLINGSSGIAVGMATNIPPHNLGEVVDAAVACIDHPDLELKELLKYLHGPDFPTGGFIVGRKGIREAYRTGRGRLVMRARAGIETQKSGKVSIVITEIPYQVSKGRLIEQIAQQVRDKKLEGIADLRDESDREGMRLVLELKREAQPRVVLNQLYQRTQMQETFGVILLALVNKAPRILDVRELFQQFIDHRHTVVTRRAQFELDKAEKRAHILEGLKVALSHINEVVELIKKAKDPEVARERLMTRFKLSEIQAQAILDLRLARLTSLERSKLDEEYEGLLKTIAQLKALLASRQLRMNLIKQELLELKKRYGDDRRTEIIEASLDLTAEDLIAEEEMVITLSRAGYIKRLPVDTYRRQQRGGRGVTAMEVKEEDFVEHLFVASTHHYFLVLDSTGKCCWLKVYDIPQAGRVARGKPIVNLLDLEGDRKIAACLPVRKFDDEHYVIMVTRQGVIKKTALSAFSNPRRGGIVAINLPRGDELIAAAITEKGDGVILGTQQGMAIRFPESEVREMGRAAYGVKGITPRKRDDRVVAMVIVKREGILLVVSEKGYGKRTPISEYRLTHRGGKGVTTLKLTPKTGRLVTLKEVADQDEVMVVTQAGVLIRVPVLGIRTMGRATQGVKLIRLGAQDRVMDVARVAPEINGDRATG